MELVGNPVHADAGVVSSAAPSVAIEFSDQSRRRDAPAYASNDGVCHLLRYNPLARLLGYSLGLALVVPVSLLDIVPRFLFNMARHMRNCDGGRACGQMAAFLLQLCSASFALLLWAIKARWAQCLTVAENAALPLLLSVLPVWRSSTAKLRAFAGVGNADAVHQMLQGESLFLSLLCGDEDGYESGDLEGLEDSDIGRSKRSILGALMLRRLTKAMHHYLGATRGDPDPKGGGGDTACRKVARRLLKRGADPNFTARDGQSPLHFMCLCGFADTARTLLKAGADPNLRDQTGKTPLHVASSNVLPIRLNCQPALVALLLEEQWDTDPNIVCNSGHTAFMAAKPVAQLLLAPVPGWEGCVEQALAAADETGAAGAVQALLLNESRGLRALQLLDMLWAPWTGVDLFARRMLVFEKLIKPLVRAAPLRALQPHEKALLIHACRGTAGPDQAMGKAVAREGHRTEFDALLTGVMGEFSEQLAAEYAALAEMQGGAELIALPATALLHGTTKGGLRQDAPAVGGPAPWLNGTDGDLAGAFRCALEPSGALDSPDALCALLQGGRNPLFAEPHLVHFNGDTDTTAFWQHVCALQSVARHKPLNAEFHAHIKAALHGLQGAHFKDAPLKRYERVAVKAAQYHDEGKLPATPAGAGAAAARVIDIVRCSFEVPSAKSALALCAWLDAATLEQHGVLALRRKNGFHKDAPSAGGYRDMKYNLLFESPTITGVLGRVIVEVQIIVEAYLKVKKKMHAVYRIDRGDFG
jgi:hypothetical protein